MIYVNINIYTYQEESNQLAGVVEQTRQIDFPETPYFL